MSNRKIKQPAPGKPKPPLTRLKELPAEDRSRLMEILRGKSYAAAAPECSDLVGFACSGLLLSRFFQWQSTQEDLEQANDTMAQVEEFIARQNKEWSVEKVRDAAIIFFTQQTTARKDLEGFVSVTKLVQDQQKGDRESRKLTLEQSKFEFDAAKACLAKLPELKVISTNKTLSEPEKVEQIRQRLFGVVPPAKA